MLMSMSIDLSTLDIPKNPAERRAWVCYRLRVRGNSLRNIAYQQGVTRQAVSNALMSPSQLLERAIAAALDLKVEQLFPERFDATGHRLTHTRQAQRITRPLAGNVQKGGEG